MWHICPINSMVLCHVGDMGESKRLPAMLADALLDDSNSAITPLDRLAYMGHRGIGALEFRLVRGPKRSKATALKLHELASRSQKALAGQFAGDKETEAAIMNLIQVGTSADGARVKEWGWTYGKYDLGCYRHPALQEQRFIQRNLIAAELGL
ncbi:hypothetical protein [Mycoavidus sp. B2-EB]|uniref:hypothetical protein n=1 Tax=Mycoavidus sp. B2-EB TaxID=2651972 RepID=UPI0016295380|nr:hypothetical protein [Mycoavidus sp. B2-EB]BBO59730.1 toxin HipA [Mycoavidus sp. B2-EB]